MFAQVDNGVSLESESWHALEDAGSEEIESDGDEDDDPFITSMLASLSASATASGEPARDAPAAVASEAASASRVVASTVEAPERAIAAALVQRSQSETFLEIDAAHDYPGFVWCHPAVFPESDDEQDLTLEESKEETEAAEEKDGEEPQSVASTSASLQVSCMIFTCKIYLLLHSLLDMPSFSCLLCDRNRS